MLCPACLIISHGFEGPAFTSRLVGVAENWRQRNYCDFATILIYVAALTGLLQVVYHEYFARIMPGPQIFLTYLQVQPRGYIFGMESLSSNEVDLTGSIFSSAPDKVSGIYPMLSHPSSICLSVHPPFSFKSNRLPQFSFDLSCICLKCVQQHYRKSRGIRILIFRF